MHRLVILFILLFVFACEEDDKCPQEVPEYCARVDCSTNYEPVCGCDGRTYTNSCIADCSGITSYSLGECSGR